ncbi:MAG TPA: phytanoyl-CoA dioxygenase family protein [Thermoanaerobaculia bacterium]
MQPKPRLNDPALEAQLERDGYAITDTFIDASEIARLKEIFETHDSPIHRQPFSASILSNDVGYRSAVDRELKAVLKPRLDALFNGYRHSLSNFAVKEPVTTKPGDLTGQVMIHQDIAFVDESRYQSLGVWCPLVDADTTNGCLYVLPGSHRFNTGPRGPGTPYQYRALDADIERRLRAEPMKAGSAMIFCQKLFHASPPNRGKVKRVAVGALLVPKEAQLYCYYPAPKNPGKLEVFAVDDEFYTQYTYRSRPEGVPRAGVIDYWYAPLDRKRLAG